AYPGEALPGVTQGINYWEAAIRGDRSIGESIRVAGGYAYSPNVSNTGARSQYVAAGLAMTYQLPCCRNTSVCRSPPLPAIPGSAVRIRNSAASRCLPISIGRPV